MVNDVTLYQEIDSIYPNNYYVKKNYAPYAKQTGVNLDTNRILIEKTIIKFLSKKIAAYSNDIGIPQIVGFNRTDRSVMFRYINGSRILEINPKQWPTACQWIALIDFLISLYNIRAKKVSKIFSKLIDVQEYNRNHLFKYKCLEPPALQDNKNTLCLGDISLSNLLYDNRKIYLIDFEFAHLGYAGYDIGQLGGQLQAMMNSTEHGYSEINSTLLLIENRVQVYSVLNTGYVFWKEQFYKYYIRKYL